MGTRALVPVLRAMPRCTSTSTRCRTSDASATVADITGYCVPRTSKHVAEAADFLAFASGDRGSRCTAETGSVVPANLAALHSPAFTAAGPVPAQQPVFDQRDPARRHDAVRAGLAGRGQPDPAAARPAVLRAGPRPRHAAAADRRGVRAAAGRGPRPRRARLAVQLRGAALRPRRWRSRRGPRRPVRPARDRPPASAR